MYAIVNAKNESICIWYRLQIPPAAPTNEQQANANFSG